MRQNIICGIDIGNSSVKTIIGGIDPQSSGLQIIGFASVPSTGLRRGVVIDMEETIGNIHDSVRQAETMAGVKVNSAYVSINGLHIKSQLSHGVIAVSRADNEISQYDIDRVIDAAAAISLPANREIVHVIPRNFIIDGQEHVKNALGMKGVRLEADVLIIDGLSPYIRNLAKCINSNEIEVTEFVYGPLATAKAVLDKHQLEHGVLHLDFGGGVSTVTLFHESELIHTATLPIGSRHITNDLAIAFRTAMDKAETIKYLYGSTSADESSVKGQIDLSELLGEENFIIPKKQIAKIIDARVSELLDMVTTEIKKTNRGFLLPAGIVITGGGANLIGLAGSVKNRLKLSVAMGRNGNSYITSNANQPASDPTFATCLGLISWGFEKDFSGKVGSNLNPFSHGVFKKGLKWLKNFMP